MCDTNRWWGSLMVPILYFCVTCVSAQAPVTKMDAWQDSLNRLVHELYSGDADPVVLARNTVLVRTLVSSLKEQHSFDYSFGDLEGISLVCPPDSQFRIFSWNVPLNDGSYLYYGAIQSATSDGSLMLTPLLDQTFEIEHPPSAILHADKWYGAQYYEIVTVGDGYALLGWKGHTDKYTQKVIEPLRLADGEFTFGKSIFTHDTAIMRRVFSFSQAASMYLRYDPQNGRIVFDHISPADSSLEGDFRFYGPDLSFDAYLIKGDYLELQENILLENVEQGNEDLFIDPTAPRGERRSGF